MVLNITTPFPDLTTLSWNKTTLRQHISWVQDIAVAEPLSRMANLQDYTYIQGLGLGINPSNLSCSSQWMLLLMNIATHITFHQEYQLVLFLNVLTTVKYFVIVVVSGHYRYYATLIISYSIQDLPSPQQPLMLSPLICFLAGTLRGAGGRRGDNSPGPQNF